MTFTLTVQQSSSRSLTSWECVSNAANVKHGRADKTASVLCVGSTDDDFQHYRLDGKVKTDWREVTVHGLTSKTVTSLP